MAKDFVGVVVSNRMLKTLVVNVENQRQHPIYKKIIRRTKRYKVHNNDQAINIGDTVAFKSHRPISKDKRFIIVKVIRKATSE